MGRRACADASTGLVGVGSRCLPAGHEPHADERLASLLARQGKGVRGLRLHEPWSELMPSTAHIRIDGPASACKCVLSCVLRPAALLLLAFFAICACALAVTVVRRESVQATAARSLCASCTHMHGVYLRMGAIPVVLSCAGGVVPTKDKKLTVS